MMIEHDLIERIAVHEAGHVAAHRHFERANFLERGYVLITAYGYGRTGLNRGSWLWGPRAEPPPTSHGSGVTAMAGRAAEAIRYPGLARAELVQWSGGDEEQAWEFSRTLHGSKLSDSDIIAQVEAWEIEAAQIVCQAWAGIKALAEMLMARFETRPDEEVELPGFEAIHAIDAAVTGMSP